MSRGPRRSARCGRVTERSHAGRHHPEHRRRRRRTRAQPPRRPSAGARRAGCPAATVSDDGYGAGLGDHLRLRPEHGPGADGQRREPDRAGAVEAERVDPEEQPGSRGDQPGQQNEGGPLEARPARRPAPAAMPSTISPRRRDAERQTLARSVASSSRRGCRRRPGVVPVASRSGCPRRPAGAGTRRRAAGRAGRRPARPAGGRPWSPTSAGSRPEARPGRRARRPWSATGPGPRPTLPVATTATPAAAADAGGQPRSAGARRRAAGPPPRPRRAPVRRR